MSEQQTPEAKRTVNTSWHAFVLNKETVQPEVLCHKHRQELKKMLTEKYQVIAIVRGTAFSLVQKTSIDFA